MNNKYQRTLINSASSLPFIKASRDEVKERKITLALAVNNLGDLFDSVPKSNYNELISILNSVMYNGGGYVSAMKDTFTSASHQMIELGVDQLTINRYSRYLSAHAKLITVLDKRERAVYLAPLIDALGGTFVFTGGKGRFGKMLASLFS